MKSLQQEIEAKLRETFAPRFLKIEDDSAKHAGHVGARSSGGGHFKIEIVASAFEGKGLMEQHRLVYAALAGWMGKEIHALALKTGSPSQASI